MRTLVGLLRGVNVGGNCMLAMADLAALCTKLGFADVRTYIQSGNVVFRTELGPIGPARRSPRHWPRTWAARST